MHTLTGNDAATLILNDRQQVVRGRMRRWRCIWRKLIR